METRTVASSKAAGRHQASTGGQEDRSIEGARIETPKGGKRGAANAFLAYLRPIKAQFFVKSPLDRLGGAWPLDNLPLAIFFRSGRGHSGLAGEGDGPPCPSPLGYGPGSYYYCLSHTTTLKVMCRPTVVY